MRQIWKFTLDVGSNLIDMPLGAEVLAVQMQGDAITLWAIVNPRAEIQKRAFTVVGTGQPLPPFAAESTYLATVQEGPFVWHVFMPSGKV